MGIREDNLPQLSSVCPTTSLKKVRGNNRCDKGRRKTAENRSKQNSSNQTSEMYRSHMRHFRACGGDAYSSRVPAACPLQETNTGGHVSLHSQSYVAGGTGGRHFRSGFPVKYLWSAMARQRYEGVQMTRKDDADILVTILSKLAPRGSCILPQQQNEIQKLTSSRPEERVSRTSSDVTGRQRKPPAPGRQPVCSSPQRQNVHHDLPQQLKKQRPEVVTRKRPYF